MAFRLDEIRGDLKRGVARTSHYELLIGGNKEIAFRTVSVTAPGRSIGAAASGVYGATQEVGHSGIYAPVSAQIYCSPDHSERKYFNKWQDFVIGSARTAGGAESSFDVGYYKEYVRDIIIKQYDEEGKEKHEIKLIEAYPRTVGELSYSYQASELLLFTVSLQYRYFEE
jgi:hypothetical protein